MTGDTEIEPWILLTNDDGVDSPALPPLLTALRSLGPVRAVLRFRRGAERRDRNEPDPEPVLGKGQATAESQPQTERMMHGDFT